MESSNGQHLEDWLDTLTEREHLVFDRGFCAALEAVMEDFTDAKIKIFNKLAEVIDEDNYSDDAFRKQLLARVSTLDIYEKAYRKRVDIIKPSVAALM